MRKAFHNKKTAQNQQYDLYWGLTVEYTDIYGEHFNNTLKIIITFIDDKASETDFTSGEYDELQILVNQVYPKKDMASVRKSINQFIKLGFVLPYFRGYHRKTKEFLNTTDKHKKKNIFSQIFYESASFSSSFSKENTNKREVNFLLKTLIYHPEKKLTKNDIIALMVTNIEAYTKGYLTSDELNTQLRYAKQIKFEEKKYNQISYMFKFLNLMPDLSANENDGVIFKDENNILFELNAQRDPYLFNIYKDDLKNESTIIFGEPLCYLEKRFYKGLVASHIKPLNICLKENKIDEAYDYNNGLLLQRNIDVYFDTFDISFDEDGNLLSKPNIAIDSDYLKTINLWMLNKELLNEKRLEYLAYHRKRFNEKNNLTTAQ